MSKGIPGVSHHIDTPCGLLRVTINSIDGDPVETFIKMGNTGSCCYTLLSVMGRLISYQLQGRNDKEYAARAFNVSCPSGFWKDGVFYSSCLAYIRSLIMDDANHDLKQLGAEKTGDVHNP